jgi:hypothetical protein
MGNRVSVGGGGVGIGFILLAEIRRMRDRSGYIRQWLQRDAKSTRVKVCYQQQTSSTSRSDLN